MSFTEDGAIFVAVGEIDKQFFTCCTCKTGRMPVRFRSHTWCQHCHFSSLDFTLTIVTIHILFEVVFYMSYVHTGGVPSCPEFLKRFLLSRGIEITTEVFTQVLLRELYDEL
jgi:hypothetical protein